MLSLDELRMVPVLHCGLFILCNDWFLFITLGFVVGQEIHFIIQL